VSEAGTLRSAVYPGGMRHLLYGPMRLVVAVGLLCSTLAPAAFAEELIVDDSAASVQVKGTWATSTNGSGFIGNGYRFRVAGDGSNSLRWPFVGTSGGSFEVFARWTSGPNRASNATYVVTSADGSKSVKVDQRTGGGVWQSLGTFRFTPGSDNGVSLSDMADGVVVADAIRFVSTSGGAAQSSSDARFFEQTRFRVDRDAFWDFFQKRGGVRTFGFPVTREFMFFGCATQLFQRVAMQQCGTRAWARSTCSRTG
jgi:hypothetical protein